MRSYKVALLALFGIFLVATGAYLHRVPGLLGDEGSEGENVYELLHSETITVIGERSYIGPAIDYIRVPFIWIFGYSTLGIRIPMFLFGIATFFLAASVLRHSYGDTVSLFGLAAFALSPAFLLYGRLGWAITLYPFFVFLILYFLQRPWRTKWLWAGLAAGLGLANHIVFAAALAGLTVGVIITFGLRYIVKSDKADGVLPRLHPRPTASRSAAGARRGTPGASPQFLRSLFTQTISPLLLVIVGFWAGFGMQFVVLQLKTEDQGNPSETTQLFNERVRDAIAALPLYLSGSSYAARYTGIEFPPLLQVVVTGILALCILTAAIGNWKNPAVWGWLIGLHVHFLAMLYIIDRFTLRYFWLYALGIWLLAGLGVGSLLKKVKPAVFGAPAAGLLLAAWMFAVVFIPFLRTGGSTAEFGLGNRTDSAAAFVDIRPLLTCVGGQENVFSESVHIWNRLQYLSHSDPTISVLSEEDKEQANVFIDYRTKKMPQQGDICPELTHFRVREI